MFLNVYADKVKRTTLIYTRIAYTVHRALNYYNDLPSFISRIYMAHTFNTCIKDVVKTP